MILVIALMTAGVSCLYSGLRSSTEDRNHLGPTMSSASTTRRRFVVWLRQVGLSDVRPAEFMVVELTVTAFMSLTCWLIFGGTMAPTMGGLLAIGMPVKLYRSRRMRLRDEARRHWPSLIEEVRVLTTGLGRSVPVAFFEAGLRVPSEPMRAAFAQCQKEWLRTTDFEGSIQRLKLLLADPTADSVCEILLLAYTVGGTDLDSRLDRLAQDRRTDLNARLDATSRQAGARFARWFVIVVPLVMAGVGMTIGEGRSAYATPVGQILVASGIGIMGLCWWWSGTIMRLPEERRVLA
jgi:tight adherence protein B